MDLIITFFAQVAYFFTILCIYMAFWGSIFLAAAAMLGSGVGAELVSIVVYLALVFMTLDTVHRIGVVVANATASAGYWLVAKVTDAVDSAKSLIGSPA